METMNVNNKLIPCTRCKRLKASTDFYIARRRKSGLMEWCKECCREYHKKYSVTNREKLYENRREWSKTSPKYKTYLQRPDVKEKQRIRKRAWDKKRANDPLFRLNNNVRTSMCHALNGKKGFRKWETLVGYTLEDLIKHLSPQLTAGMTWDNYGETWQVDHITPKSWYKYDNAEHPAFKECWALSNLQPKLTTENQQKGNRFKG